MRAGLRGWGGVAAYLPQFTRAAPASVFQTRSLGGPFGCTQGDGCCVSHLWQPLKSALSILCFPLANMWGVTWYCTRAWTTYNISKQFPNCFQAKVDSLYGSNPFVQSFFLSPPFFMSMHRLGDIKVLSKLDPGRLIHWEMDDGSVRLPAISVTIGQWISFCLDGDHMFIGLLWCKLQAPATE